MEKIVDKKFKLNNGAEVYFMGIGTHKILDQNEISDIILSAIGIGYKRIDCSSFYKQENIIAKSILQSFLTREEIFISSSIWAINPSLKDIEKEIDRVVRDLKLKYLDLLIINGTSVYWEHCYEKVHQKYKEGLIKVIGVKDFSIKQLKTIKDKFGEYPSIYQTNIYPGNYNNAITKFCNDNNILINAIGIFHGEGVLDNEIILELAKKYLISPYQVIIKWAEQRRMIINPKTDRVIRLVENVAVNGFKLSPSELCSIDDLKVKKSI